MEAERKESLLDKRKELKNDLYLLNIYGSFLKLGGHILERSEEYKKILREYILSEIEKIDKELGI